MLLLGALLAGPTSRPARADDYVVMRSVYYREASTRVIQPIIELERDSPSGIDVGAHFLVDAITSASIAAGTAPGQDTVFTETRNEAGLSLRKRWSRAEVSAAYKYSAESDYWSHGLALSGAARLWHDTATARLALGRSFDSMASRYRMPDCAAATPDNPDHTCALDTWFAGASYTQVLTPVAIVQLNFDTAYLDGFQGNIYRQVPGKGYEVLPYVAGGTVEDGRRLRNAVSARLGFAIPQSGTGFQLNARYYWDVFPGTAATPYDPWGIQAYTVEARVYQQIGPDVELRVLFRQYLQTHGANFWCDTIANPGCYATDAVYYSNDPKLGPMHTEYPEVKVYWQAEALRPIPILGWFATGTFELSAGVYFQSTSFGNAAVVQAGYTMPY